MAQTPGRKHKRRHAHCVDVGESDAVGSGVNTSGPEWAIRLQEPCQNLPVVLDREKHNRLWVPLSLSLSTQPVVNDFLLLLLLLLLFGLGEKGRGREREKERESQAVSTLSAEPKAGLDPTTPGSLPALKSRIGCSTH